MSVNQLASIVSLRLTDKLPPVHASCHPFVQPVTHSCNLSPIRAVCHPLPWQVHGKFEGNQLYTSAYVSRVKAVVRGGARAVTTPLPTAELRDILMRGFAEDASRQRGTSGDSERDSSGFSFVAAKGLFASVFAECVAEGDVSGSMKGGGGTWTPDVFASLQGDSVTAFLSQVRDGPDGMRAVCALHTVQCGAPCCLWCQQTYHPHDGCSWDIHGQQWTYLHVQCFAFSPLSVSHPPSRPSVLICNRPPLAPPARPQNRFITYDAVRQLSVAQPKAVLRRLLGLEGEGERGGGLAGGKQRGSQRAGEKTEEGSSVEYLFLDSSVVHSSLLAQLEAAVEEAVTTGKW